jgi:hypothetical protein
MNNRIEVKPILNYLKGLKIKNINLESEPNVIKIYKRRK